MVSPLNISPVVAAAQAISAKKRFAAAQINRQYANLATIFLLVAVFVYVAARTVDFYSVIVFVGAIAISVAAKARAESLERKMWWHQMRAGLVGELTDQNGGRMVIDLRDSAHSTDERMADELPRVSGD